MQDIPLRWNKMAILQISLRLQLSRNELVFGNDGNEKIADYPFQSIITCILRGERYGGAENGHFSDYPFNSTIILA
jgi:hypothetical protein